MKDTNLKELKPVYLQTDVYPSNDEISLVDLTKTLIKHKKIMIIAIFLTLGLASTTIFFKSKTYTYTTSVEIGTQVVGHSIKPIESPEALLAKINNIYIPVTLKDQRVSNPDDTKKYKIKTNIPTGSLIIIMEMKGSEDDKDVIKNLLHSISKNSILSQSHAYESIKQYTTSRLNQANAELRLLKNTDDNETEIAVYLGRIDTYTSQLATLRNAHVILPVTQSIEPTGLSRTLLLVIAVPISVLLGIFSAFFAEFVARVKEA